MTTSNQGTWILDSLGKRVFLETPSTPDHLKDFFQRVVLILPDDSSSRGSERVDPLVTSLFDRSQPQYLVVILVYYIQYTHIEHAQAEEI